MNYCIDRFEGDVAVCIDTQKKQLIVKRDELYKNAKDGDWFEIVDKKTVFLKELTEEKRKQNILLLKELTK